MAVVAVVGALGSFATASSAGPSSQSLFAGLRPATDADPETNSVELGVQFRSDTDGVITGVRYYRVPENQGPHTGTLWSPTGDVLARTTFTDEGASGWQQADFSSPVKIVKGQLYVASYRAPHGRYAEDQNAFSPDQPQVLGNLTALSGVYSYGESMPSEVWRDSNYYVDVVFTTAGSTSPPTSTTTSPTPSESTTTPTTTSTGIPASTSTTTSSTTSSNTTRPSSSTTTRPSSSTASSSASSSASTAPTPPPAQGCAARPSACGYPDATNTGVQAGVTLTKSGCITATTPGQVIENVVIDGCTIGVEAKNVVIRNVKLVTTSVDMWAIIVREGASAQIQNVEIAGRDKSTGSVEYAILSQTDNPVTVDHANLHHCADCIQGEAMTVTNSYIHDMANPPDAHVDGFQCNSSCEVTVRHNTILNEWWQTSAIALFADFGTPRNSVIDDNLLAGGGYTVYAGTKQATGIRITNNRFSRIYYPNSGQYGPGADYNPLGSGNTWSGNIWDDTAATVGS